MASPSVTWSFTNGTTSDASQVNTNFTDLINALSDSSKDLSIGTVTVAGAATFNGNVALGNAAADDITVSGSLASNVLFKANATYGLGSATAGANYLYLGNGIYTTKLVASNSGASFTFTLPAAVPSVTGMTMVFDTNATASFRYPDKFTATKTANYTATGDETVILCDPTTGGASFTVTLPAASTMTGKELTIVKVDAGLTYTVTIDGNASETILPSVQSSQLTYILYTQYESVTLKCNGTSWYVMDHYAETDWNDAGTITITGTTTNPTKGTTSLDKIYWRRKGRDVHIKFNYRQTGAGASGSGDYLFAMPTGLTIDTAQVTTDSTVYGSGVFVATAMYGDAYVASTSNGMGRAIIASSTTLKIGVISNSPNTGVYSSGYFGLAAASLTFGIDLTVPISGWNP